MHRARRWAVALGAIAMVGAAGCGDDEDFANEPRPPAPVTLTASISKERVSVSPKAFGAGPIELIITNQTDSTQRVTLETDEPPGSGPGIKQVTGPINPRETASLKANLDPGTYSVQVDGGDITDATLRVGDERASSQDDLLLP